MRDERGPVLCLVLLAIVALIVVAWGVNQEQQEADRVVPADVVELLRPTVRFVSFQ